MRIQRRSRAQADACWRTNLQAQINPPRRKGKVIYLDSFLERRGPTPRGGKHD